MKRSAFIGLLFIAAAVTATAAVAPFERYQSIIDRKPFGEPPPEPQQPTQPKPPGESFAKYLRMCSMIEQEDGSIKVGFVNQKTKKSFSLFVGSAYEGIELVEADYQLEEAVLRQGEEMALVKMNDPAVQRMEQKAEVKNAASSRPSYAARRAARIQRAKRQPPPEPKFTGEELEKHLQEYNVKAIREGLPALPIPLTPEQDEQLVKEGVLPPME